MVASSIGGRPPDQDDPNRKSERARYLRKIVVRFYGGLFGTTLLIVTPTSGHPILLIVPGGWFVFIAGEVAYLMRNADAPPKTQTRVTGTRALAVIAVVAVVGQITIR